MAEELEKKKAEPETEGEIADEEVETVAGGGGSRIEPVKPAVENYR